MDTKRLSRLMAIDELLAGPGLHVATAARAQGVTIRTIWRDLEMIRSTGCQLECRIVSTRVLQFHVGERLFNVDMHLDASRNESDTSKLG
jgi:predicted DNA-binding transcriptional regulator YafY